MIGYGSNTALWIMEVHYISHSVLESASYCILPGKCFKLMIISSICSRKFFIEILMKFFSIKKRMLDNTIMLNFCSVPFWFQIQLTFSMIMLSLTDKEITKILPEYVFLILLPRGGGFQPLVELANLS